MLLQQRERGWWDKTFRKERCTQNTALPKDPWRRWSEKKKYEVRIVNSLLNGHSQFWLLTAVLTERRSSNMALQSLILTKILFQSCNLVREVILSGENAQQKRLKMRLIFQLVTWVIRAGETPSSVSSTVGRAQSRTRTTGFNDCNGSKVLAIPLMKG